MSDLSKRVRWLYPLDPDVVAAARAGRDLGDERAAWALVDAVLFSVPIHEDGLVGAVEVAPIPGLIPVPVMLAAHPVSSADFEMREKVEERAEALGEVVVHKDRRCIVVTSGLSELKAG